MTPKHETAAELLKAAIAARNHSYSPYSKFRVGAALIDTDGRIFAGCNVENSSYGATVCAERSAISAMVTAGGKQFSEILVVTDRTDGTPPCGICRQVLLEFSSSEKPAKVHIANDKGVVKTFALNTLLAEAFHPAHLAR
jgi:cytidine deaminase